MIKKITLLIKTTFNPHFFDIAEYAKYGIPVVLVVIEGGLNTIRSVWKSVKRDPAVPVVIANGSGRAADILAYALARTVNKRLVCGVRMLEGVICFVLRPGLLTYRTKAESNS